MYLEVKNICKKFDNFSLNNVTFNLEKGDYFIVLGVSGSGKSVLLEILSGLINVDSGSITLDGKDITNEKIQKREIGILFQDFAVFPHMTVRENIAYPLKLRKINKSEINDKVQYLSKELGIEQLLDKNVGLLSGGEAQRVALARTLAISPKILLLDEPLSALDIILRNELRSLLRNLNRNGQTIIHVTHDYEEAVSLANEVAIIQKGKIIQSGKPKVVFQNPKSEFVANFSGIQNFFKVKIYYNEKETIKKAILENGFEIAVVCNEIDCEGNIIIRSENILISEERIESSAVNNFKGIITDVFPTALGVEVIVDVGVEFCVVVTKTSSRKMDLIQGKEIWISFKATSVQFIG